jgi:two-component system sensor histidine kinase TctE
MAPKPSLPRRLSQHVLVPLVLTWAFGTAMVLSVAQHFAAQAFDRALLDDTYALAAHVRAGTRDVSLTLTGEEMKMLLFDQSETIYFAVFRPDGSLATGNPGLRPAPLAGTSDHEFADVVIDRQSVRTVTLQPEGQPFTVVMGQTAHTRSVLLEQLLAWSALPQAMLLALLAWWLRRRIQRDLQPLGQLEEAIGRRHAADLAPLPDEVKAGASTRDVERIAQAIDSMLARLAEGVQAQREFAGNVAHELRTPLAGIRAQAAFALSQPDAQVWRTQLEGIAQAEQRASRLVDQLLALARAREGRGGGVAREPIALDAIAREVLLRFMPRARSAGVDLGGEGLDEPIVVQADRALVEGILNNLVDNALRYGAGHAEPRITVAIARAPGGVELSVTDNGEGWPSHDLERLTRRWEQGDPGRRAGEGAGLGLAIVTRYAELLGAQFSIGEAPGGGARATLLLAQ